MADLRKHPLYVRDCRLCEAPLAFGVDVQRRRIPLDLRSAVWALVGTRPLEVVPTELAMVDHRSVCPLLPAEESKKLDIV
jgi:hypothetical protein